MNFRNKINLSITLLLILTVLLFVFLIYPIFSEIKKSSQELLPQKERIVYMEKKTENLENFKAYYREIEPNVKKIDKLFIDPEIPIEFISFLEKTSRDSNIAIKISPALPAKIEKDPYPSFIFQISSASSFPVFLKFLEKLESSAYLIEIQNLNILRLTEAELRLKEFENFSSGNIKANLSLKVYAQ